MHPLAVYEGSSCFASLPRLNITDVCNFSHCSRNVVYRVFSCCCNVRIKFFVCEQALVWWNALFSAVVECPEIPQGSLVEIRWIFVLLAHSSSSRLDVSSVSLSLLCSSPLGSDVQVPAAFSWAVGLEGLPSSCARVIVDTYTFLYTLPPP